jgi:hypothetical protein
MRESSGFLQAALAADNLFHHLTYEGAVDLDKIDDPTQRAGIEAQVFSSVPPSLKQCAIMYVLLSKVGK